jgi:hypothetical protein
LRFSAANSAAFDRGNCRGKGLVSCDSISRKSIGIIFKKKRKEKEKEIDKISGLRRSAKDIERWIIDRSALIRADGVIIKDIGYSAYIDTDLLHLKMLRPQILYDLLIGLDGLRHG